ncbi:MAG: hypothetical protein ACHREM_17705 [Polyangiales bacterium]
MEAARAAWSWRWGVVKLGPYRAANLRLHSRELRESFAAGDAIDRSEYDALIADFAGWFGKTRPRDLLVELCGALSQAGLTPSEIMELLERTGLEHVETDVIGRTAALKRVQKRVERARASERRARSSAPERAGNQGVTNGRPIVVPPTSPPRSRTSTKRRK